MPPAYVSILHAGGHRCTRTPDDPSISSAAIWASRSSTSARTATPATTDNHGAHFSRHVLGYNFGVTCQLIGTARGPAASLRVQDLFQRCPKARGLVAPPGVHDDVPGVHHAAPRTSNLAAKVMASVPRQHVGICWMDSSGTTRTASARSSRQTPGAVRAPLRASRQCAVLWIVASDGVTDAC